MAHLPEQFDQALANVEPEENDKTRAASAHGEVRRALEGEPSLIQMEIDTILIGSYARQVSIRRMKDVDVFSKLERCDTALSPGELLDLFERALTDDFGPSRVKRRTRTVEVDFPESDLFVDVVPARPGESAWEIPDRQGGGWVTTNPEGLTELTSEMNQRFRLGPRGAYVPTVKLVRQVRRTHLAEQPAGVYLEICCYWALSSGAVGGSSIGEYLSQSLTAMCPVLDRAIQEGLLDPARPNQNVETKADAATLRDALEHLQRVADEASEALADTDDCRSARRWRDVLGTNEGGPVFPMPGHCSEDGTRREVERRPGSRVVPTGEGKFAIVLRK
jgi:SMODS domain-containing protein